MKFGRKAIRSKNVLQFVGFLPRKLCTVVMGRCRYLTSVLVFGIFVGIFSSRFGTRYRYFKISRYRFGISVFQLVQGSRISLVTDVGSSFVRPCVVCHPSHNCLSWTCKPGLAGGLLMLPLASATGLWKMRLNFGDLSLTQWLKWFCEAGGGGSPDEARLEQTPYPFQPH